MKLNIFIDGTWLFRACAPRKVLSGKTETPEKTFSLNFGKLNNALLNYVRSIDSKCSEIGDCFLSTSIFELDPDIDSWPEKHDDISLENIEQIKRSVHARSMFADNAVKSGYSDSAVYHPKIKPYMIPKINTNTYQEKQVDASIVALLVKYAIINPDDYHAVITGDSDILPAIRVAYPEYTKNVVIVTTHPDELSAEHRQASFSLNNFDFEVPAFFLQDHVNEIMHGEYVYKCAECNKTFQRYKSLGKARPYCVSCVAKKQ